MASTNRLSHILAPLLCSLAVLSGPLACSDSPATTAATANSAGMTDSTTAPGTTADTTTTSGVTEAATTSAATTTTSSPETTTGPITTEATATTAVTTEATGEATETAGTSEASETSDTTGVEPVGATCEQDSDCQLYTDCCTCDVIANDEAPPACDVPECFAPVCATLDIGAGKPVCRFGRCTFEKVTCNPLIVSCKAQPPNCPPGQIPSVEGDCWSGSCTPVEACDWVPDCKACTTDPTDPLVCVFKVQHGAYHECVPKPVGCGDAPEIDCECGAEICDASPPHDVCLDHDPGIICECPNC